MISSLMLLRMVPFVENNYNVVELGPRGTGKSHLFQQISPYAHLVSGGKATVARIFVNMSNDQRGLVCQYDVACFDEVSGVSFDQKDGVNIMKGYMESGEFSRGKESIRAYGSIVMVGNFEVDVQHQQHYRRPHMALVWTGRGRAVPKSVPRRGSVVHREVVEKLPSGFAGEGS
jgi:ATP-dependent Lon protease